MYLQQYKPVSVSQFHHAIYVLGNRKSLSENKNCIFYLSCPSSVFMVEGLLFHGKDKRILYNSANKASLKVTTGKHL